MKTQHRHFLSLIIAVVSLSMIFGDCLGAWEEDSSGKPKKLRARPLTGNRRSIADSERIKTENDPSGNVASDTPNLPPLVQTAPAQNALPTDIKDHLTSKYNLRPDDVFSQIQQTPAGPKGYLDIKGRIVPNYVATSESLQDKARASAESLLKEEPALFGSANMDEIRRIQMFKDKEDHINIRYLRYIGDWELRGAYVNLRIAPDGSIVSAKAYLIPTPLELYHAAATKTLTEAEIRTIVEDDMQADAQSPETTPIMKEQINNFDTKLMRPRKFAIPEPPYLTWEVHTAWVYTIDALSGKILKKSPIVRTGNTIYQKLK